MLFASAHLAVAEQLEFIYEHYSSDDGLPHNSICDIHQDAQGYLWLSTWYGLSRFDGNNFVNYMMKPGDYSNLSHNRILSVTDDKAGYLWVMAYDYRLYRFDKMQERFVAIPSELKDFPESDFKADILYCDTRGNTWVSFSGYGLMMIDKNLNYKTFHKIGGHPVGSKVSSIHEDSQGIVYVVSDAGITMIDNGQTSLISRNPEVLGFVEHDGKLVFARSDRLLVVDMDTREQFTIDLKSCAASDATSIALSSDTVYVGFRDNTIASVDFETMSVRAHRTDMGRVRYLFPDPEGLLWIATERTGIWSYNPDTERFKHYEHPRNVKSYYVDTLARVDIRDSQRVWIKMNNWGFGYYDREADQIVPLSNVKEQQDYRFMNGVACFEVDSTGVLWMSTAARGLEKVSVINPKAQRIVPPTKSSDKGSASEIRALLRDSKGRLWAGAKSRELFMYSPDLSQCRTFPDRQSGDIGVIYSLFEDRDGNLWIGTKGDGIVRLSMDGDRWTWKHFRAENTSLTSNNIYSIEQDKDGRIWVGTYGGSLCMLQSSDSEDFVTVMNSFPDYPQESGSRVRYLHCMPDGKMLVATVGGLIWFEPVANPELTLFHSVKKIPGDIHSLGNNDVIHIFTDKTGNTWLCTFGGGINRMYFEDDVPRFDVYCTDNGLTSNIIQSATDDSEGMIWLASESSLSKIDPQTGIVTNFTRYDGVPPALYSEATCTTLQDGTIVFGTTNNICRINPSDFVFTPHDCRLTITGLSIDGQRTPFQDRIIIPSGSSFFRIDFASLNFSMSGRTDFSYKLEGFDKNWIDAGASNSATYSRIPPGKYVLVVRTEHPEGIYTPETVRIQVRVRPSIWNSVPAYIFYVVISILLILLLIRLFLGQMKLRNDVKLEQDLNEIKGRFFTNISHELRTPLTLILGGIDDIERSGAVPESAGYSLAMVQKNARRMMTLVNQLLDIRTIVSGKMRLKISQFDIVKLVQGVYDDFRDMAAERQMEMRFIKSVDSLMVWGDAIRIEALVYNLLSNAFKYTSDGGKIEVGVLYREGEPDFRIMVKDNGIGVPKDKQQLIFEPFSKGPQNAYKGMASSGIGLSFCKEIADIHGGRIWVESHKEGGSKFFVRLPISRERFRDEDVQFVDMPIEENPSESYGLSKYKVNPTYPEGALKLLVVEDNAELRVYIYNCLVNRFEVKDAANGMEALEIISQGWMPDIIVTDLMMPVMDGIELINNIRSDFNTSHIPIVMITAKHENDTHLKAMKYGADGYIAKPFTMELLTARIDNLLERRRALISSMSSPDDHVSKTRKVEIAPEEIVITDRDEELIKKVIAWLEEKVADSDATVEQLASYVGMGRTSMYNKIKGLTGKSPVELIQEFRMEKATFYLKSGQYSVSETSYKVGFSDPGYFSRSFKKHYGMSPADYIKQNRVNNDK